PETIRMLFTSQRTRSGEETGYGIGWRVDTDAAGRHRYHHTGGSVGGRAVMVLYPAERVVVAALANLGSAPMSPQLAERLAEPCCAEVTASGYPDADRRARRPRRDGRSRRRCRRAAGVEMKERFLAAQTFAEFVEGAEALADLWKAMARRAVPPAELVERASSLGVRRNLLVLNEDWCGDAVNTVPYVAALAEAVPGFELRIVGR